MSRREQNGTRHERLAAAPADAWTSREAYLLAMVCLLLGMAVGYLFRGSSSPVAVTAAGAAPAQNPAGAPGGALHSPEAVKLMAEPLLAALQADPKNFKTLADLGNLYYDNHLYKDAIAYYQRALELRPADYNVRTDLGTALWYSGQPERAVLEYHKALQEKPSFAPTLLNLGIVRMEGLKDHAGAIAAWEELLTKNPDHPEKQRVQELIARARGAKS